MRWITLLLVSVTACTDDGFEYRRENGTVVEVKPCEDGDIMCLDILDANVDLFGTSVGRLEIAALLRGPFDDNATFAYGGANIVKPEYIDDANDSYGSLERFELALRFVPGEDRWHAGHVVHLVDNATDGASLPQLCGQPVFAEITLGAPSTSVNHGAVMSSTTWLKGVTVECH